MLNRDEFCKLTNLRSVETLKYRARHGQLPISIGDRTRKSYGYSTFDAFVTIIADRLSTGSIGMNADAAVRIAKDIAPALALKWPKIVESARTKLAGDRSEEIEWQIVWRHMGAGHLVLVGPTAEIVEGRGDGEPATDVIGGNATNAAVWLLHRADHFEIELPEEDLATVPDFYSGDLQAPPAAWTEALERFAAGISKTEAAA